MNALATSSNHASNRLGHGDCTTLPDAVLTVCAEVQAERAWHQRHGYGIPVPLARELDDLEQRALTAKLLYEHGQEQQMSEREIAALLRDVGLVEWADALEASDYTTFAI